MGDKTKKEHYVPRCYLENWKNNKGQVWVYDRRLKKTRINNVYDIACERYFYDIDYKKLSVQKLKLLEKLGIEPAQDEQFIEHFFSEHIEGVFSRLLTKILNTEITSWREKECYFISKQEKLDFAVCVAFQYTRTNETRRMIVDMADCLEQALQEMNVSEDVVARYTIRKDDERIIHGNMLLDIDYISNMALSFYNLTWILAVNKTSTDFYTSDNPIGTIPHAHNDFISMSGINSKGVEVFFPLSPRYILLMYDSSYHKNMIPYDRRYLALNVEHLVRQYNKYGIYNCNRCVFSRDGDLSVVDEVMKTEPEILDVPKTRLSWGGKSFFPRPK